MGIFAVSSYVRYAFITLLLAWILVALSFSLPFWTVSYNRRDGLWTSCTNTWCHQAWVLWWKSWVRATQAFMTMSIITISGSVLFIFFFIFHKALEEDRRLVFLSTVLSFATNLFLFIAIIIWCASEYYDNGATLSFSFAFACFGWFLSGLGGYFTFMDLRQPPPAPDVLKKSESLALLLRSDSLSNMTGPMLAGQTSGNFYEPATYSTTINEKSQMDYYSS